ncbi:MAG: nitroreductase family protein [Bacteroidota bacterium]|nr:nitroreductase family protein [Bacteroidota bacterium]
MNDPFIPLAFERLSPAQQREEALRFFACMRTRRSVRAFSPEPVPFEVIETCVRTAGTAPSGANQQPWRFVVVSDPSIKRSIRLAAEEEERDNYERRFPDEWKQALAPLGTDWHKEFLETVPYLIVVFQINYTELPAENAAEGTRRQKHYYVTESVGIAVGFLIAALHKAGLATLTHTPNPMGFLNRILERPRNEKPFVLLPVGYPAPDVRVPDIDRKQLEEILLHRA